MSVFCFTAFFLFTALAWSSVPRCCISRAIASPLFYTRNPVSTMSLLLSFLLSFHFSPSIAMSPDGLVTFPPISVYFAQNSHYLLEVSSGPVVFFLCSTPSVSPRYQHSSLTIQSILCFSPSLPFHPDLASICFLLFSQAGFLCVISCEHPLYFFHCCIFAWTASYTRTLNLFSSPIGSVLFILLHRHLLRGTFLPTTTCLSSMTALSPPVFVPLLSSCFPGL